MNRIWKGSLIGLLAAACACAGDARKEVAAAEEQWKAAVLAGDAAKLDKLLAPDLSYTHSSAKTQTKDEFIKDVTKTTTYKSIDFTDTAMRQYGNTVVVTHKAAITSVQTGTSNLYITEVWVQQGGHWVMASRQATKIL
jgi:ketosteroid isomerase-like protein